MERDFRPGSTRGAAPGRSDPGGGSVDLAPGPFGSVVGLPPAAFGEPSPVGARPQLDSAPTAVPPSDACSSWPAEARAASGPVLSSPIATDPRETLRPGRVIDRYVVEGVLGEGGMGLVLRVQHTLLGSVHALKVLTLQSPQIRDRLRQEGALQAALAHPNVVAVTDVIEVDGDPALVLEYVDGPSLEAMLRGGRPTADQVDHIARGVLAGVAAAHRCGLVHRDLKPGNVLLKPVDGRYVAKVADFGLAKALWGGDPSRTRSGTAMGTPNYMSPEQARDAKSVGTASDVFSLGAILYELCTGARAFDGPDVLEVLLAVAAGRYTPPRAHAPDLPDAWERAIVAALQVDPSQRPPSVDALLALWAGDTDARSVPSRVPGTTPPARRSTPPRSSPPGPTTRTTAPPRTGPIPEPRTAFAVLGATASLAAPLIAAMLTVCALAWWSSGDPGEGPAPAMVSLAELRRAFAPAGPLHPGIDQDPLAPSPMRWFEPAPSPPRGRPASGPRGPIAREPVRREVAPSAPPLEPVAEIAAADVGEGDQVELFGMQADPDPAERRRAVEHLERREDDESIRVLATLLRADPDAGVREAAWDAVEERYLDGRGDEDRLEKLVVEVAASGEGRIAEAAARALGERSDRPEDLAGALRHPSAGVRAAAAEALAEVARRSDDPAVAEALLDEVAEDPDPTVRKRASRARGLL